MLVLVLVLALAVLPLNPFGEPPKPLEPTSEGSSLPAPAPAPRPTRAVPQVQGEAVGRRTLLLMASLSSDPRAAATIIGATGQTVPQEERVVEAACSTCTRQPLRSVTPSLSLAMAPAAMAPAAPAAAAAPVPPSALARFIHRLRPEGLSCPTPHIPQTRGTKDACELTTSAPASWRAAAEEEEEEAPNSQSRELLNTVGGILPRCRQLPQPPKGEEKKEEEEEDLDLRPRRGTALSNRSRGRM